MAGTLSGTLRRCLCVALLCLYAVLLGGALRFKSCGFYRVDFVVRIPLCGSIVRIPFCGFPCADSIHRANFIMQISLCGFCHANSIMQIRFCGFHRADSILSIALEGCIDIGQIVLYLCSGLLDFNFC